MPTKKNALCELTDEEITTYFLFLLPNRFKLFSWQCSVNQYIEKQTGATILLVVSKWR